MNVARVGPVTAPARALPARRGWHPAVPVTLHAVLVMAVLGGVLLALRAPETGVAGYLATAPVVTLIFVAAFGYHLVYENEPYDTYTECLRVIAKATLAGTVVSIAAIYLLEPLRYPRTALLLSFPLVMASVFAAEALRLRARLRHAPPRRAVVLGPPQVGLPIVQHFEQFPTASVAVVDRLDSHELASDLAGEEVRYDIVLIPGPRQLSHTPAALLTAARSRGLRLFMLAGESAAFLGLSELHELGGLPWHELRVQSLPVPRRVAKRALDLLLVLAAAPLTLLAGVAIALAIRGESPGPLLHRQPRAGRGGKTFTLLKFRTMRIDAELGEARLAAPDDPRVTRVGRFLRRHRLDEMPQLWNVLRGDMSLVGPRPERPEFVATFEAAMPGYGERHMVRPGITGLAQVLGAYDTPAEHKVRYDILYLANWSVWLDVQIMLKTAVVMARGKGGW